MTNDEGMSKLELYSCHPERSRRIPWNYAKAFAAGFLDFARNDWHLLRHSGLVRHSSFVLRHFRNHSLDVLGENIELKIYEVAGCRTIKVGMTLGIGNDPDHEARRKHVRNGKTDPIEGDRTLGSHIMSEVFRQFNFESEVCAFRGEDDNGRDAIDVALHEMSADAAVSAQRALQIYATILSQLVEVSASDCLLEKIEG